MIAPKPGHAHRLIMRAKDNIRGGLGHRRCGFSNLILPKTKATGNDLQIVPFNDGLLLQDCALGSLCPPSSIRRLRWARYLHGWSLGEVFLQTGKGCAPHHLGKLAQDSPASSYWSHAACLARKRARAFFPSLAASAMLSKKPDEHSTNPERPAR